MHLCNNRYLEPILGSFIKKRLYTSIFNTSIIVFAAELRKKPEGEQEKEGAGEGTALRSRRLQHAIAHYLTIARFKDLTNYLKRFGSGFRVQLAGAGILFGKSVNYHDTRRAWLCAW